jgi:hypothetical protein
MSRTTLGVASALVLLGLSAPAVAQFGSIFGGRPPRPPADVPAPEYSVDPRLPQGPRYDQRYERDAPQPPPPPLTRFPSGSQPRGGVQTQPLPPPPGAAPAQPPSGTASTEPPSEQATREPITGPGRPPLVGLPPGQRQPRGTPQPGATAPQNPDEVVVAPPKEKIANPTAVFAGLDKITGRIISFDVAINETVQFGALRLTPRACYTRPPTETPNTDGFVQVDEITLQGEVKRIFSGWMFAASPGLHGIEHPIYDVWLTDCKSASPQVAGADAAAAEPAAASGAPQAQPPAAPPSPPRRPARRSAPAQTQAAPPPNNPPPLRR